MEINRIMTIKTVKASEFKAKCLQFMDEVKKTGTRYSLRKTENR